MYSIGIVSGISGWFVSENIAVQFNLLAVTNVSLLWINCSTGILSKIKNALIPQKSQILAITSSKIIVGTFSLFHYKSHHIFLTNFLTDISQTHREKNGFPKDLKIPRAHNWNQLV